jgi:hypothetical protein
MGCSAEEVEMINLAALTAWQCWPVTLQTAWGAVLKKWK